MSFAHVDLEGLVLLVTSIPSGFYIFEEGNLMETYNLGLSVLRPSILFIMTICESLYVFPSAARESFSDDG